jgi:hypothetical protein
VEFDGVGDRIVSLCLLIKAGVTGFVVMSLGLYHALKIAPIIEFLLHSLHLFHVV